MKEHKPSQNPKTQERKTGAFNADTGKRVESKNEFRDAFRKRKLVINL